ncbi:hypothetical protein [Xenorhabdus anantnagensis]|uniref:Uncharacterized protein n=1 Tax=Xenorhabdus anantnagensis TaxID=3025875 RepID=A0ABT5LXK1_9GAMM|nr:hypothetical protein [Xenorhabdus anantnagensis]MDC9597799.1 hypothetical protein [Xenorhabdus anantnagensis]
MVKKTKKAPLTVSDKPLLEKKARNDAATGEGNTFGEIVGQPPQVTTAPAEASPVLKPGTQNEQNFASQVYESAVEMGKGRQKISGILGWILRNLHTLRPKWKPPVIWKMQQGGMISLAIKNRPGCYRKPLKKPEKVLPPTSLMTSG